ncbi:MAG: ABC transporter ATP-binding protein [Desulfobacter sp.]|nr:MAG: ABC transporter ATP-binding protein [Desulfobacter sp.]
MPEIQIDCFTYYYPEAESPALEKLSLGISKGEFVGIIGANNSGKSSLCYALSGIIPHLYQGRVEGRITIHKKDTAGMSVSEIAQDLGMVMQNPVNQLSGVRYSVFEEVAFGLENQGIKREAIMDRVNQVLTYTGLEAFADRSPFHLSGGQQQRLALACALGTEPGILVLDEPTTFLDPQGSQQVFEILHRLNQQGTTLIIAEQNLGWIAEYADRVVALKNGAVVMDGRPEAVLTSSVLKEIRLEWTRYTKVARLAREKGFWMSGARLSASFGTTIERFKK